MPDYKYKGHHVPLKITYGFAYGKLKELGVDVLSLFEEESNVIQTIMLNDKVMLDVRFHFLREANLTEDFFESIEDLDGAEMQRFKEAFWESVVNFSPPPARDALLSFWTQAKKQLKSQRMTSGNTSSDSLDGQE